MMQGSAESFVSLDEFGGDGGFDDLRGPGLPSEDASIFFSDGRRSAAGGKIEAIFNGAAFGLNAESEDDFIPTMVEKFKSRGRLAVVVSEVGPGVASLELILPPSIRGARLFEDLRRSIFSLASHVAPPDCGTDTKEDQARKSECIFLLRERGLKFDELDRAIVDLSQAKLNGGVVLEMPVASQPLAAILCAQRFPLVLRPVELFPPFGCKIDLIVNETLAGGLGFLQPMIRAINEFADTLPMIPIVAQELSIPKKNATREGDDRGVQAVQGALPPKSKQVVLWPSSSSGSDRLPVPEEQKVELPSRAVAAGDDSLAHWRREADRRDYPTQHLRDLVARARQRGGVL